MQVCFLNFPEHVLEHMASSRTTIEAAGYTTSSVCLPLGRMYKVTSFESLPTKDVVVLVNLNAFRDEDVLSILKRLGGCCAIGFKSHMGTNDIRRWFIACREAEVRADYLIFGSSNQELLSSINRFTRQK
jgi:hypothetical protein